MSVSSITFGKLNKGRSESREKTDRTSVPAYSIAIRTLGTAGDKFRRELESIATQTIQPDKVVVYIAEGYPRPDYTIGREEYVWVRKGMMSQRILPYDDITSDCILMLDDDVLLASDSAERLLDAMVDNDADFVGADIFRNHKMPFKTKIVAALSDLVFPHWGRKWAFKVHRNGSFSYNSKPEPRYYDTQTGAGPLQLWKKYVFKNLHLEDELWLDKFRFPYAEDRLVTYKAFINGFKTGILYNSGVENLDGGSASNSFRKSPEWLYTRTAASYMIWYRSLYRNGNDTAASRFAAAISFGFKAMWQAIVMCGVALVRWNGRFISSYFKGLSDGLHAARTAEFQSIPKYCIER